MLKDMANGSMRFHVFKLFSLNRFDDSIFTVNSAGFGGFTKSGKFRCMAHTVNWQYSKHDVDLAKPGINPFFVVSVTMKAIMDVRTEYLVATDLIRWCKAIYLSEPDFLNQAYHGYISIRPKDIRETEHPKTLGPGDAMAIERFIGQSGVFDGI